MRYQKKSWAQLVQPFDILGYNHKQAKLVQPFHVLGYNHKQPKFIDSEFFRQKEAEELRERMEREKRELQEFIGITLKIIDRVFFQYFFCTKIL